MDVQGINQVLIFKEGGGGVLTEPSPLFLGPCMLVHMRNIPQEYLLTKFLLLALLSHVAKITYALTYHEKKKHFLLITFFVDFRPQNITLFINYFFF